MRVAIYARVSTDDKGQDPENQLRELRAWCVNSGHTIVREYVEAESGRKGAEKRKRFGALFDDAAKKKFDCVLFWALDRFSREGMAQTIVHLQRLTSYGVTFHSYTEPHLATDNELVRNVLLALLSSLAKVEAQKISDRTKPEWPERRPRASGSDGRSSGSNFARKLPNGPQRGKRPMSPPAPWPCR
jgi:DNA invertase Pin-like site-specific DNA recombinase